MSIFLPYSPSVVITYISNLFNITLSSLTDYESIMLTIVCNLYFFIYWFIIIYFTLKLFNRIYERIF